jgi:SAM-dependent methyltransferase
MTEALTQELGLDGRGRLIDVGCGPGIVALDLASAFEQVVGIDADRDMIAEVDAEARRRGVRNVRWVALSAEQLPADVGSFRVATLAQSFHWLDRERVASILRSMLEGSGALVLVQAYTRRDIEAPGPMPHPRPPWGLIDEVVRKFPRHERGRVCRISTCSPITRRSSVTGSQAQRTYPFPTGGCSRGRRIR